MVSLVVEARGIEEVEQRLNALVRVGAELTPVMEDIGEYLLRTTRDRFVEEEDPEGNAWQPLSEATKARKRRNVDKVLTRDGYLRDIVIRASRDSVEVGSPRIYAGTHQFGAERGSFGSTGRGSPIPFGDIPARPFLGLSADDRDEIGELVREFILGEFRRV